jgi:hypothetical protein
VAGMTDETAVAAGEGRVAGSNGPQGRLYHRRP